MKQLFYSFSVLLIAFLFTQCSEEAVIQEQVKIPCPGNNNFKDNGCKFFFPYTRGQSLILEDESGNQDVLTIERYYLSPIDFVEDRCTTKTESFSGEFSLSYHTKLDENQPKHINIQLWSETDQEDPYFEIFSPSVFHASLYLGNQGSISGLNTFEFDGETYYGALKVTVNSPDTEIEEFVLARDVGLLYFKIEGEIRKVIQ